MTKPTPKTSITEPHGQRNVWAAVMMLTACITGIISALLACAGGSKLPMAILAGGSAFASTALLLIAIAHYIGKKD
jgi:hypothetical protein